MATSHRAPALALALALLLAACGDDAPPAEPGAGTGFIDRTPGSGIDFVNHSGVVHAKDWIHEAKGGAALVIDYDGDGRMDLYVVDGNSFAVDEEWHVTSRTVNPNAGNRLYRNEGDWRFTDVTEEAGVADSSWGFGGGIGDFDNDGHPDLYVCNWGPNRLFRNRGDGTFEDVAATAGVAGGEDDFSTSATFFDADADGDLDLYVSNYLDLEDLVLNPPLGVRRAAYKRALVFLGPNPGKPLPDRFYRNEGDGTFREETAKALVDQDPRYGFLAVAADYDRDGDEDLYVANDSRPNTLWLNDGSGRFHDGAEDAMVDVDAYGTWQAGMGNDSADYDQDGWPDIFVTNFAGDKNTLYRNLTGEIGKLAFEDRTGQLGLETRDFNKVCWGTKFTDLDQDGYLDLFVAAGHVYPEVDTKEGNDGSQYRQLPSVWINQGPPGYTFEALAPEAGGPGLRLRRVGRGASFADFDDDGDVDVYVYCLNDHPLLLENRLEKKGGFFQLALEGTASNRSAYGTRVTLEAGKLRQMQEMRTSASFLAANSPRLHWGLGAAERVDALDVEWPSGRRDRFEGLAANALYRLVEGEDPVRIR